MDNVLDMVIMNLCLDLADPCLGHRPRVYMSTTCLMSVHDHCTAVMDFSFHEMDYNTLYPTGKDRLNISSFPYDKTLWSLYSSRPFCYAGSLLRNLVSDCNLMVDLLSTSP
ncbi:hypothetical protein F2Q69_00049413 [Brassica cretica]|uniref:Uncharacterized protein n=1 Tax=Brassica cretica TaxID=69181 RepID=A0A8S9PP64_BRACR|nr:hypothetical protein F2Q69_00049413 [Brassica cretica]